MKIVKIIMAVGFSAVIFGAAGDFFVFAQNEQYTATIQKALDSVENKEEAVSSQNSILSVEPIGDLRAPAPEETALEPPATTNEPITVQPTVEEKSVESPLAQKQTSAQIPAQNTTAQPFLKNHSGAIKPIKALEPSRKSIVVDILELKDMDISDVLKLISQKTGLNIVAGQNVRAKITIYLKNVDVRDALRIILESNDLAYFEEDGIIRVMTAKDYEMMYGHRFGEKTQVKIIQLKYANAADAAALLTQMKSINGKVIADEKSNTLVLMEIAENLKSMEAFLKEIDVPVMTKIFELNYAKAEDLSAKINESLTKNVGAIKFDKRSNKIIVTDTPQKIDQIESVIKAFDSKHQEVLIEAKIAQIALSDQYKMGVNWEAIVSNYHRLDLKNAFSLLNSTTNKGQLSIGTIASDDYTVLLEALDTVGTTNILSSPHITAINNEEAKILVGSTEPYVTTTTTTPATGPATTAEAINFIEVGVKLHVTPTIHKDDYITMKIKPEVSSVVRYLTTGNNNQIPVVETSEAETTVMVKNGVTIVIGGLIKDEKIESISKVPLLGDLPLVGFAFRGKDKLKRKTELVIFLTPKIITGDVPAETAVKPLSLDSK